MNPRVVPLPFSRFYSIKYSIQYSRQLLRTNNRRIEQKTLHSHSPCSMIGHQSNHPPGEIVFSWSSKVWKGGEKKVYVHANGIFSFIVPVSRIIWLEFKKTIAGLDSGSMIKGIIIEFSKCNRNKMFWALEKLVKMRELCWNEAWIETNLIFTTNSSRVQQNCYKCKDYCNHETKSQHIKYTFNICHFQGKGTFLCFTLFLVWKVFGILDF